MCRNRSYARIEITAVSVAITFVRVKNTLRVKIKMRETITLLLSGRGVYYPPLDPPLLLVWLYQIHVLRISKIRNHHDIKLILCLSSK
jgi:hypothetical protein